MSSGDIRELVRLRMQQAAETLRDAQILWGAEPKATRSVVNRAYYAAFYAVLALLQTVGKAPRKHSGAVALFDSEFVQKGWFSKHLSESLHKLFQTRLDDDYKRLDMISLEEAEETCELAKQFVEEVHEYLVRQGYALNKHECSAESPDP